MSYCPNCRMKTDDGNFCIRCGQKLTDKPLKTKDNIRDWYRKHIGVGIYIGFALFILCFVIDMIFMGKAGGQGALLIICLLSLPLLIVYVVAGFLGFEAISTISAQIVIGFWVFYVFFFVLIMLIFVINLLIHKIFNISLPGTFGN